MALSGSVISGTPAAKGKPTGKDFGDYVLLEELARGGMGIVYRARDKELNRIVAIKMIISGEYSSDLDVQRFQLEAKAAAQLDHPGIVPIYEINSHQGQPYFAMKLIEGGSLAQHRKRFQDDPRKTAKLIAKAARAVHHAHQRGILHRDIKPANILLDEDDQPLLTDLGLAKLSTGDSNLTQTGAVLGTPSYMPPEQATSSDSITTAADIYSLGAILYELLTGKPPHRGDSAMETMLQVINEPVIPVREVLASADGRQRSQVDRNLELICMKCLQKDPNLRYDSADDVADDLESWLAGSPISLKPANVFTRVTQWVRHNQSIMYVVMLLLACMTFALPLIFSILGGLDDVATLYGQTEDDPLPLLYSFSKLPTWVSVVGGLGVALLWPFTGVLITMVTRPKSWWKALRNGALVAAIISLFMLLMIGWVPFAMASQISTNEVMKTLAKDVWHDADASSETLKTKEELVEMYPVLADIPDSNKPFVLCDRAIADGVAMGPLIMFALFIATLFWGSPVIFGAVIAHLLRVRHQRWWIFVPRYIAAWMSTFMTLGMISATFGGGNASFNGSEIKDFPIWKNLLLICIPALVTFLIVRRWRKPESDRKAETES
jgi:serine/threonine protein kinase